MQLPRHYFYYILPGFLNRNIFSEGKLKKRMGQQCKNKRLYHKFFQLFYGGEAIPGPWSH
jgi:hypothetical protein